MPDLSKSGDWIPLAVGGLAILVIFAVGLLLMVLLRRRDAPEVPTPVEEAPGKDPFTFGSAREKREAPRRGGNPLKILISNPQEGTEPYQGLLLDRSVSGVCLGVDKPIAVETVLLIRATHVAYSSSSVQVVVKNCRREASGWLVGCQFVRPPPASVLMDFG